MPERAIAEPFNSEEIIEIIVQDLRKKLSSLCPLQSLKQYAAFEIKYQHSIKLFPVGADASSAKDTLAWGSASAGDVSSPGNAVEVEGKDEFKSGVSANDVRIAHNLPLTVEASDGKGGKTRKKVHVKE